MDLKGFIEQRWSAALKGHMNRITIITSPEREIFEKTEVLKIPMFHL